MDEHDCHLSEKHFIASDWPKSKKSKRSRYDPSRGKWNTYLFKRIGCEMGNVAKIKVIFTKYFPVALNTLAVRFVFCAVVAGHCARIKLKTSWLHNFSTV